MEELDRKATGVSDTQLTDKTLIEDLYECKGQFMSLQGYSFNGIDDCILVQRKTILKFIDDIIDELKTQPCGHPLSSIVSTGEGTGYCKDCEKEAGSESD